MIVKEMMPALCATGRVEQTAQHIVPHDIGAQARIMREFRYLERAQAYFPCSELPLHIGNRDAVPVLARVDYSYHKLLAHDKGVVNADDFK